MKRSDFTFGCVHLLQTSYIDSLDWVKSKKATMNLINKSENKYF